MSESSQSVIFDNGSYQCKAGVSKDCEPRHSFYTCINYLQQEMEIEEEVQQEQQQQQENENEMEIEQEKNNKKVLSKKSILFSENAQKYASKAKELRYPIQQGIIQNWDDMEKLWEYCYTDILNLNSSEQPLLMTETPLNPIQNREKTTELAFESLSVPQFTLQNQSQLALYSTGKTHGMILDIGDGITTCVPVFEGNSIQHSIKRYKIAGRQLTEYLQKLAKEELKSDVLDGLQGYEFARQVKEEICYVAKNIDQEASLYAGKHQQKKYRTHKLPDGQTIELRDQRYKVPELLFNPKLNGFNNLQGVHGVLFQSTMQLDFEVRKELLNNVLLCGGTTLIDGFTDRLQTELTSLFQSNLKVKLNIIQDRVYNAWMGGSIICSLGNLSQNHFITKQEYEEVGPSIIHKKGY